MARQITKFLSLCAGVAGLSVCGGALSAQAAEPSVYFYPKAAWQISKPAAQQCVLTNEFDNGFVVRLSGSNAGKDNVDYLSIDFIQSVFQDGQAYPVRVSVPGLVSRDIESLAENSRILQIGMRGQADLVNGLESTGTFDMALDSNNFRFYMTGLSEGLKKFKSCTSGLTTRPALVSSPIAQVESPALPEPKYEPMRLNDKPDIVEIKEILPEPAMADIQEVDMSQPPFSGPPVSEQIDLGASKRPDMNTSRPYLDKMRGNEYGEISASSKPLPAMDAPELVEAVKAVPPAPVANKNEMPEPLRASFTHEKIEAKADFTTFEDAAAVQKNEPFSSNYERIETKKKSRRSSASVADCSPVSHGGAMNVKVKELSSRVQELETRNMALKEELEESYKATEGERLAISSDNWNLERATMRFNEAERQIDRLGRQLQRQKAHCAAEKQDLEAMLFDPKLTEQSQLAELSRLEEENIRYKARIKALEAQLGTH